MKKVLLTMWTDYWKDAGGRELTEAQRVEARKAFYAGVLSLYSVLDFVSRDEVSEADAQQLWSNMSTELFEFCDGLKAGRPI